MKKFRELSRTAQLLIYSLLGLAVIFEVLGIIVSLFYKFEPLPKFTLGLVSGTLVSIIKVFSMDKSINKIVDMDEQDAKTRGQLYSTLRYFITFAYVALVIVFRKYIGVIGAIIGLLSLQVAAFTANYLLKREEEKQ